MNDHLARIENLSPSKRKLLEVMSSRQSRQLKTYPLSYTQQRLWFIDQLEPGSSIYNMPFAVRMNGALNRDALFRSFQEIVRRHEILRTRFPQRDGVAVQEVVPHMDVSIVETDLRSMPVHEREGEALRRAREEANKPFDLKRGPLLRLTLLQIAEYDHLFLISMHHIVGDGWSTAIMEREVTELYASYCEGRPSPLAELEIQYGDFAVWQRGWLKSGELQKQLQYWRKKLGGVATVDLLTDYPRPPVLSHHGSLVPVRIPEELTQQVRNFAAQEGCTVFMVLLATLQLTMSRFNGHDDVAVGTSIANRNRVETERLIGCFINTLILRTEVNRSWTFRELMATVRDTTLEAYDNQDVPFEKLVEELQPVHDLSRTPLFQVLFVLQNIPEEDAQFPGLKVSVMPLSFESAKVELTLALSEERGKFLGSLEYDVALFDKHRVEMMVASLERFLRTMVTQPDRRVSEVPLLSEAERKQVLAEWNGTEAEFPQSAGVDQLLGQQAQRTPEAVAIAYEGKVLTFAELDRGSNQLARYLRALGVGPEMLVGLCVERSFEMMIGLLGILKAGGAYVPLDPAYPAARLRYMIADAELAIVLSHLKSAHAIQGSRTRVVELDQDWPEIARESDEPLEIAASPERLAYVIYTSGSTGKPKGVAVCHRSVCNQLWWAKQAFQVTEHDHFLQKASFSFDASVIEIFLPLITGARVISARRGGEQDVDYLVELVHQTGVTCIDLPPSLLQAFVDHPGINKWTSPRLLMSGGEVLKSELVKACRAKLPGRLWNTYGPTETTVQSVVAANVEEERVIPIGRPVANTQLYVLDGDKQPQAVGMVGELYIGGEGLARGYWRRPDLTAERFIPDPFGPRPGARLYRTGDLVRWRGDGKLDFLGRADQQVKLRGFRIEPGEIETVLMQQPGVREALVTVPGNAGGQQQLVAYLTAEQGGIPLSLRELRKAVREKLPAYMVPGTYMVLDKLPLLPSGKINRKSLPQPDRSHEDTYTAPRHATEEILCGLLEEVLNQQKVGIYDSFFEMGGHSLLATQLASRIRKAFALELPLRVVFEAPTAAAMAEWIEQEKAKGIQSQAPPIERSERKLPLPLSFAQLRLWFIDHLRPGSPLYNMPLAVEFAGALNKAALEHALREIVRRHEILRTHFPEYDGVPAQEISHDFELAIEEVDLREIAEPERRKERDLRIQAEAEVAFDLREGPLFRAKLLRTGDEEHILLLTMHHIISDGWSIGVLEREFSLLYKAFCAEDPSPVPELAIQYADFAVWQRSWLQGQVLEKQLEHWRSALSGIEPLGFPADHARPPVLSHRGAAVRVQISQQLTQELKQLSRREGVTLFMSLMAAFQTVLARYSDQENIVVGTPIAGRRWTETEDLIGLFVNTLVLRTDLSGSPTFRELLARVRTSTLGAYDHQDVPFEKLVDELQPERDLSRTPLFQAMFAMGNFQQLEKLELPGLQTRELPPFLDIAKFELELGLSESPTGITGELLYCVDLYDKTTIEGLVQHMRVLLEAMVAQPEQKISEFALLTAGERQQLLDDWNREAVFCFPEGERCLHHLFEAQAAERPGAVAASCEGAELTYAELNGRANQLAHYLRKLNAGPDTPIALCLERSLDLLVGILGVLKAGAAYVPLDPNYPVERISYMLGDCGASLLLTTDAVAERLKIEVGIRQVSLDRSKDILLNESTANLSVAAGPLNAAYIIYTSGSTGRPKGVIVTHSNVARLLSATASWFNFCEHDCWTLFHSYGFDFCVWEMWGALAYGGRLVVVPYWISRSPQEFHQMLRAERVTVLNQTPSAFWGLMQADQSAEGPAQNLRVVIFGGEALDLHSLKPWFARHGDDKPELVNMYGITETTVHVTYRKLHASDASSDASLIGRRIPDLRLYILDRYMNPAPIGAVGEMFVGGAGLARGYLNRPALTAERFVPDPFGKAPGARLYRTGDLARYLGNGDVEYRGRIDSQVKIRGFRIELGEIQAALESHPSVEKASVVARSNASGDKRLVGYFIASASNTEPDALRQYLRQRLPEYMVPVALIALEQLPLTANGKINTKALPEPDWRGNTAEIHVAPRTLREELLAAIWSQVLEVEEPSATANFFDLGGDSILSIRVVALARKQGLSLSLAQIFEHPTISELAKVARLQGGSQPEVTPGAFDLISNDDRSHLPGGVEDAYPLTLLQSGMVFQNELDPDQSLYWNFDSSHLRGPWNAQAMAKALGRIMARHPVLRSSFDLTNYNEPLQLVHATVPLPLCVDDLSEFGDAEQEQAITSWEREQKKKRFDLSKPPLFQVHVHLRSNDTFQFTIVEHHAILDGWSVASLQTEIFNEYTAELRGNTAKQKEVVNSSFRQYVALERQALAADSSRDYWRDRLSGSERSRLPVTTAQAGSKGSHHRKAALSQEQAAGLRRVARLAGASLKSVLLAAHFRVLALISGRSDVVTGLVTHGRPETEDADRALGLFLNSVPFRLKLGHRSWVELVKNTFRAEWEMLPHRHYPLARIIQDQGGEPLFETLFNYVHFHVLDQVQRPSELEVLAEHQHAETEFVLNTICSVSGQGVFVEFSLAEDRFSYEQADAMAGYYAKAIDSMISAPEQEFSSVNLLSPAERKQVIEACNQTDETVPMCCVHEQFEEQAWQTPNALAVEYENEKLTYRELNERANQVAHALGDRGIGPEVCVGICIERSLEMVVSILAVLKAGGAYIPLDPSYPQERLEYMVTDSKMALIITAGDMPSQILAGTPAILFRLDREAKQLALRPRGNPGRRSAPENICYLIYTSGSTGAPKGAAITHAALFNHMYWIAQTFSFGPGDSFLQKTPFSFDASVWEFYAPLLTGATLVMARPGGHRDSAYLVDTIRKRKITVLQMVPSMLDWLVREEQFSQCTSLRLLFSGGEVLREDLARAVTTQLDLSLVNLYGPAEATIDTTYCQTCRAGDVSVSLGRPIANARVYVLDESYQPALLGVTGELFIAGTGLARGYWKNPGLTAERFLPDPFSANRGERLYKTGDLARWLPDGTLEFQGRGDHQVKIRGHRIELEEIEAVLNDHPEVEQAVVALHQDAAGESRLIAYIVGRVESLQDNIPALRIYLKRRLPDSMIPQAFVPLKQLPLNASGKVDRQKLPKPEIQRERELAAPRDYVELELAKIWQEVLRASPLGIRDDFFEAGGHSLLALRLVSLVEQRMGTKVPLASLLERPTIEQMATLLRGQSETTSAVSPLVELRSGDSRPPLFLVHGAGSSAFSFAHLARHLDPGRPVYAFQDPGLEQEQLPARSVEQMAREYLDEMRSVQLEGPYLLAGWSMGGLIAFEMARELQKQGQEVGLVGLIDTNLPAKTKAKENAEDVLQSFLLTLGFSEQQWIETCVARDGLEMRMERAHRLALESGLLPPGFPLKSIWKIFSVYTNHIRAVRAYRPTPASLHLHLWRARDELTRTDNRPSSLKNRIRRLLRRGVPQDASAGWKDYAARIEVRQALGNHFTVLREPNVRVLAHELNACLSEPADDVREG